MRSRSRRRRKLPTERELTALRDLYCGLYAKVQREEGLLGLSVDELRAPLSNSAMMRAIAKDQGLRTLGELLEQACRVGAVDYDLSRGKTLRGVTEWVLAGMPRPRVGQVPVVPAATSGKISSIESLASVLPSEERKWLDEIGGLLADGTFANAVREGWEQFSESLAVPLDNFHLPYGVSRGALVRMAGDSIRHVARTLKGEPASFVDDLRTYCDHLSERDREIIFARLGISHPQVATLESLGVAAGITRERARQIESRFRQRAGEWTPPLAILAITATVGRACGRIVTPHEWFEALPEILRPLHLYQMRALQHTVEFGWIQGLLTVPSEGLWLNGEETGSIGADSLRQQVDGVRQQVTRQLHRWGAVDLQHLSTSLGQDAPGLAHALLSKRIPCPVIGGWLVPSKPRRSALRVRVGKVFRVTAATPLTTLRRAVKRSLGECPPDQVLIALLRRDYPVDIDPARNVVTARVGAELPELSGSEKTAIQLVNAAGGAISLPDLQRGFVRNGYSAPMATILGSKSPVLHRPAPSILAVVGNLPPQEQVQDAQRRLGAHASDTLLGYRNLPGAQLEVSYRIDPALLSSIFFKRPTERLAEGEYRVLGHDGECIEVKKGYLTGVRKIARSYVNTSATVLHLTFELSERAVSFSAS